METTPKTGSTAVRGIGVSSVLAIVGGALSIAGVMAGASIVGFWNNGWMMSSGMMGGIMSNSFMWGAMAGIAAIWASIGGVSIAGGLAIYRNPESANGWGIAILIASIIGLLSMSGFFVGPVLGIISGILAMTKK